MAKWTFKELAAITGKDARTIANWRKEGMPILDERRKRNLLIDSAEFFEWWSDRSKQRIAKGVNPDSAEYWTRRKRQLEVEEMEGLKIDRVEYVNLWNNQMSKVRKMVLSIPNRCASLVAMQSEEKARIKLEGECKLILRECVEREK